MNEVATSATVSEPMDPLQSWFQVGCGSNEPSLPTPPPTFMWGSLIETVEVNSVGGSFQDGFSLASASGIGLGAGGFKLDREGLPDKRRMVQLMISD